MILGLDVSTSITGVCVLDDNGLFEHVCQVDLRKIKEFTEKCASVALTIAGWNIEHIFIEDKLSGFSGGRTSQQTIMKLAAFNGAVTYVAASEFVVVPIPLHPSTIKATMARDGLIIPKGVKGKDKKQFTAQFVKSIIPEFPYEETKGGNLKAGIDDMADAYCVARAGYLKFLCGKEKS